MKYLGLCVLAKHEQNYISDWIRYHLGVGFETIILYDNDSPDRTVEIAKDIGGNRIIVHPCPGHPVQHVAYARCLEEYRNDFRYLCFLDVDEYIVSFAPIHEVLKAYEQHPAVCPHWILFGSNGHEHYDSEPVPVRFTRSQGDVNLHIKSIVNPLRTFAWVTAHRFTHDTFPVDENHRPIAMLDSTPPNGTADVLYVAHYVTKSKAECWERRSRARPDTGEIRYNLTDFWAAHDRNDRENLDVLRTWKRIKEQDVCYYKWNKVK